MLDGFVIRGTTPEHEFELPYSKEIISDIRITYGQGKKALFTKTLQDCKIRDKQIVVALQQEETFLFSARKLLNIEIRIKLINDTIVRNEEPIVLRVIDSMDEEVIE